MKSATKKTATKARAKSTAGLSAEEIAAMKETLAERKAAKAGADGEADLLAKIAEMKGLDKEIAEALHAIVKANAPNLKSKTWYGMPAYSGDDGKAVLFLQPAAKFKARYATLGFNDSAKLDDGNLWPTSYAVTAMTEAEKKKIAALVKKAAG